MSAPARQQVDEIAVAAKRRTGARNVVCQSCSESSGRIPAKLADEWEANHQCAPPRQAIDQLTCARCDWTRPLYGDERPALIGAILEVHNLRPGHGG